MSQAGFEPLFATNAQSTEWESDALTNQATTAGSNKLNVHEGKGLT